MDYDLGDDARQLRDRLRRLISEHIPDDFLGACTTDPQDLATTESFCKLLAAEDLLALAWPEEHGGGGGSIWQQTVLREEMWARHEPRGPQYMGINWVGPAIMRYGTPAQKTRHLSAIAAGEVVWCQGFSEPEAGTDLASLRTRAVPEAPDGPGWRITGQKVWTSYAQMASWCVLAACTHPDARKPKRLTLFLLPMDRPGFTVRPIPSMLGPHHLNEMFLDEVPASPSDVLGEPGDGWRVMREALAFERVGIARYARCESLLDRMRTELGDDWARLPESSRVRWVRALADLRVARLLAYRAVALRDDPTSGAAASAARIVTTTCDQQVAELLLDVLGPAALDSGATAPLHGAIEDHWRYAQAATVASGTIEVQRMLVARDVLGEHR
ncbi:acyl-CoA dehydrogenase family protein [Mycobacterium ulcerans]|uniref:Acyl-CoA dehydrogenase FadE17_2 n=1 Tax=Mycobacterium ulcerans (strain Agy99) TaxID=362242 RepID=A0PUB1_MYCUA|nr:acyl-CoA dehydrogenase family protein [Mycobacterium ulcerans]ABL05930.1 acyl-CoA dehydrogenase FadE17_2 [Mycobacterium ulcerans Agy99]MEB3906186.1 acyl-CoA dehydrogenase family protein [Mycobacterium ulcerans]MEB3910349.1 acyl-CoA dehydrogenase family protein [Mycobacterium ulcerans]MEB3920599.1 acyl-CoA dehydrogenase family protein [Mycobacterium ulcerans]MEB3924687.1 acyl-CoA dehydrogenase family protein [Mycobacterium ulcerans]